MIEDREVTVAQEFTTEVLFVIATGSAASIYLDEPTALSLRDELNKFLGVGKQHAGRLEPASHWYVGQVFKAGSNDPHDLPVGSQLQDASGYNDIMEKTEKGWKWIKVLGTTPSEENSFKTLDWDHWKNDWDYTLIRLGR